VQAVCIAAILGQDLPVKLLRLVQPPGPVMAKRLRQLASQSWNAASPYLIVDFGPARRPFFLDRKGKSGANARNYNSSPTPYPPVALVAGAGGSFLHCILRLGDGQ
jgi:hypothetical protein